MRTLLSVWIAVSMSFSALAQVPSKAPQKLSRKDVAIIENGLVPAVVLEDDAGKTYKLEDRMRQFKVPGLSVAVFDDRRIRWARGYGYANSETRELVDQHTRFQAASISKPVTAFAVLRLVLAKRLDLDRDVNDYLVKWKIPDSPFTQTQKVTIRRLLSHTAGLNVAGFAGYDASSVIPDAIGVLDGRGNSPALRVEAVPGSKYAYSGGGYVVLQQLIEDQSGVPFETYLQAQVLRPLGMNESSFDQFPRTKRSLAYDFEGKPLPGGWHVYPELAPAGLWTTPSDIARFCFGVIKALAGAKDALLPQSLAQQMVLPNGTAEGGESYGLGFELHGSGQTASFGHGGSNAGFKSELYYYPARKLGLVLMSNSENGRIPRNELARSISNRFGLGLFPPRIAKRLAVPDATLREIAGRYRLQGDEPYDVSLELVNGDVVLWNLSNSSTESSGVCRAG